MTRVEFPRLSLLLVCFVVSEIELRALSTPGRCSLLLGIFLALFWFLFGRVTQNFLCRHLMLSKY